MAKKKKVLWGRVFAFVGILLMVAVVVLFSTNSVPSTTLIRSILSPKAAAAPKPINVLEIRYFPYDPTGQLAKTNALSSQLKTDMTAASIPKGYKNSAATAYAQVVIKRVVERDKTSPKTTGSSDTWYHSLNTILTADGENLCDYIVANNIDQVWGWFDVRAPGSNPPGDTGRYNQEFTQVFSSALKPGQSPVALCGGRRTFTFFGFDQNRSVAQAMHSFGHSAEAMLASTQGSDLFWTKWSGGTAPGTRVCGSVHIPPNGQSDYDYADLSDVASSCENWKPDGTGTQTIFTCSRWLCKTADIDASEEGYHKWWFQNMPNANNGLVYNGKGIPNWWDFVSDIDVSISNANKAGQWMTPQFASFIIGSGPTATPTPKPATPTPVPSGTPAPTSNPTGPRNPVVDMKLNGLDRVYGAKAGPLTLTWTTSGASSCVARGAWTGTRALSGSLSIPTLPTMTTYYVLECTGPTGIKWYDQVYYYPASVLAKGAVFGKIFINGFYDTPVPTNSGISNYGPTPKVSLTKGTFPSLTWAFTSNTGSCTYSYSKPLLSMPMLMSPIYAATTYSVSCQVTATSTPTTYSTSVGVYP